MSINRSTAIASGVALVIVGGGYAATSYAATPTATASAELAEQLAFSREEERMARDLYAALAQTYDGATPFSKITTSEQRHYDAVGTLLTSYGIDDPSAGLAPGRYADADLQALYDDWLAKGSSDNNAAYAVGVELEQRDIADLKATLDGSLPADVRTALERLLAGSENHLKAYTAAVNGTTRSGMGQGQQGQGQSKGQAKGQGQGRGQRGPGMGQQSRQHGSGANGVQGTHSGDCPLTQG